MVTTRSQHGHNKVTTWSQHGHNRVTTPGKCSYDQAARKAPRCYKIRMLSASQSDPCQETRQKALRNHPWPRTWVVIVVQRPEAQTRFSTARCQEPGARGLHGRSSLQAAKPKSKHSQQTFLLHGEWPVQLPPACEVSAIRPVLLPQLACHNLSPERADPVLSGLQSDGFWACACRSETLAMPNRRTPDRPPRASVWLPGARGTSSGTRS